MAMTIEEVEGIGPVYVQKLIAAGVKTDVDMLERAGSAKGRTDLAAHTGISGTLILRWANHVDLMRISGVGPQYAELLEASGVDTVKEASSGEFVGEFGS
jgi:predicted flap endonuclease-1-like 5' DNA nuclease